MKKKFFSIFAVAAISLCSIACSKQELLEETETLGSAPTTMSTTTASSSTMFYGVNGHPLGTRPYISTPAKTQISLLKNMGMNIYRIDVMSQASTGEITVPHLYGPLKDAARATGVTLLPMLYPRTLDFTVSESDSYHRGRVLGDRFARKYKDDFTYYNLANELENRVIYYGKSGAEVSHYDIRKFKIAAAYLKGMDDGIKSKDPDAKTVIDVGWMHYQFLLMLQKHGVRFDIVGYHWYDEMETLALKNYNISDMTKFLSTKFSKPIWFTEIGFRNKTGTRSEAEQEKFLNSFLAKCRNNQQVKAAILYELFDQPQHTGIEAFYGIYKWTSRYTSYTAKSFAN
ncbi:MAG TPA: glycosyl hydrolase [Pseudosphingobacterium sp.]|nr:glycosyl hydrolase [Pseudosphingobacterium sp.]